MTLRRLLANLAAGVVLVAILVGLVIIMVDERASKQLDNVDITYEEVKW